MKHLLFLVTLNLCMIHFSAGSAITLTSSSSSSSLDNLFKGVDRVDSAEYAHDSHRSLEAKEDTISTSSSSSTSECNTTTITIPLPPNTTALIEHENSDGSINGTSGSECLDLIPKTECTATCEKNAQGVMMMMMMIVMAVMIMMVEVDCRWVI